MAECYFVGGPNGSGKSTVIARVRTESPWREAHNLNADEISRAKRQQWFGWAWRMAPSGPFDYWAAQQVQDSVDRDIVERRSFIVETVLSSDKFFARAVEAAKAGFSIEFSFVFVDTPQESRKRVDRRQRLGGHGVPPDKLRKRWPRVMARAPILFALADAASLYDNTIEAMLAVTKTNESGTNLRASAEWYAALEPEVRAMVDGCLNPPDWLTKGWRDCRAAGFPDAEVRLLLEQITQSLTGAAR